MANRKVAVYKQVRVNGVWVKCPPYVHPKNHKVENDKVLVGGKMEIHPEGDWGIFYYEGGKRKWKKVGPKYPDAKRQADTKELALRGRAEGLIVEEKGERTRLRAAIDLFLEEYQVVSKTYQLLSYDLKEFADWIKKDHVEDITRKDLLRYKDWIQTTPEIPRTSDPHKAIKMRSERTACNKVGEVNQFHRWFMKIKPGEGLITGKDIKPLEKRVEIYSGDELKSFFAACTPIQHLMFTTFLQSGMRKQELMHMEWTDVDYAGSSLRVTQKKRTPKRDYEFSPKTHEEREITVPGTLLKRLAEHQKTVGNRMLVFPTRSGRANEKIWDLSRGIAKRAGIDPATVFVHKFRATFASLCLQRGMDLKTVQEQLGHKDIDSTMRYLSGLKGQDRREKVASVWAPTPAELEATRASTFDEEMAELDGDV